MKNNIWMITLWAGILFFSGATAGFFASHLIAPPPPWGRRPGPPPPPSPEMIKNMARERTFQRLKMTPEQQQQAEPAIDRWVERMEKLRRTHAPEYLDVFNEFFDQLDRLLTPQQKPELEKLRREITEMHVGKNINPPGR
jgi:Spy/CpxP family protein refolding chaperone